MENANSIASPKPNTITGTIITGQNPTKTKLFLKRYGKLTFIYGITSSVISILIIATIVMALFILALFAALPEILFLISSILLIKKGHKLSKGKLSSVENNRTITSIIIITSIHALIMIGISSTYILNISINDPPVTAYAWSLVIIIILLSTLLLIMEILLIIFGIIFKKKY